MAPLFETLDDLTNAPGTMTTLLGNEWYLKHINGKQECMIGEEGGRGGRRVRAGGSSIRHQLPFFNY